ncbi:hypothetical protein [Rhizobium acaciae]|uniref:hypothetical protein n=1 Tax=Rhizobium acaciae TaxID=2989736 RepID=UPI00222331A7|nr:hypothetical protein [Rhizobium acaciae]
MKARRNFVVEFKSSRPQAKGTSASIWGDTDLQAITRAVESDLPNAGGETDAERAAERSSLVPVRPAARILETIDMPSDQLPAAPSGDPAIGVVPTPPADADETPGRRKTHRWYRYQCPHKSRQITLPPWGAARLRKSQGSRGKRRRSPTLPRKQGKPAPMTWKRWRPKTAA